MKTIVRAIFGLFWIVFKHFVLVLVSILGFLWELDFKFVKEVWKDHSVFYKSLLFGSEDLERYRYDTFFDFIIDNKNFSKKWL
jgi:hypothetical protein